MARSEKVRDERRQCRDEDLYADDEPEEDEPVSDSESEFDKGDTQVVEDTQVVDEPDAVARTEQETLMSLHHELDSVPHMHLDPLAEELTPMLAENILQRYKSKVDNLYTSLMQYDRLAGGYLPEVREVTEKKYKAGRMWLLPGSESMPEWAFEMRTCYKQGAEGGLAKTAPTILGAFSKIMMGLADKLGADFILIDAGPSSDEVNKIIATSCDYIQPTVMLDFYNWASIRGLLMKVLPSWFSWQKKTVKALKTMQAASGNAGEEVTFNEAHPFVLPFLGSNYGVTKGYDRVFLHIAADAQTRCIYEASAVAGVCVGPTATSCRARVTCSSTPTWPAGR